MVIARTHLLGLNDLSTETINYLLDTAASFDEISERFAQKDISLPAFLGGYRVVPERIEFWAGGGKRLHDRFEYSKNSAGHWDIERLQP